ncbi:hypothetical protein O4328_25770 [Rhodococcus opacus]|uniref:Alpha/beta hydrolase family protein n=1 Tax=Rhodococcus opacus TaxID=37919 RepID=A0AAX3Y4J2_RHOOP|nr:hypothetical protein [Rhodococcus opacus]MCZ4587049.1 hypothetical protein [Rhodococcus opacus]WLF44157.1 hypothetical protein Q5707_19360 [Rhodococcus opacus]
MTSTKGTRWLPLAAVAVLVVVLAASGIIPVWPGLLHLVALPPLDQFADLRLLLVRTASWPQFLILLAVVSAVRVILMAWLLGGLDARRLRFAAVFYAVAFGPVLLATLGDATAYATLYSRAFWPAVALVGLLVLILGSVPWQGGVTLRGAMARAWRRGLRIEVMVPYCAAVLALGALADRAPALTVLLVPASAAATGLTVWAMDRAPLTRPVTAFVAVLVAVTVASVVFVQTRRYDDPEPGSRQAGSLFIMSGINSRSGQGSIHRADVHRLGYECDQVYYFSYAGPGDGQPQRDSTCPIRSGVPYEPADTQRPVEEQVALFAEQTANLQRPLIVAAHSHAAWIAWEAVATGRARVDVLVLVGVFPETPLGFPPPDVDRRGRVFGDLLRWAAPATDIVFFPFDPDTPAARQLLGTAGSAQAILGEPLPGEVRVLSITSAADLPLMPHGWRLDVERNGCPVRAAHSSLPTSAAFDDEVIRFLDHRDSPPCPMWRDWGAVVMQAFGVPPSVS